MSANNELEIQYIANEAAVRYKEKNIVEPVKVVVSVEDQNNFFTFDQTIIPPEYTPDSGNNSNTGLIVGIVIGVAVVLAAGVTVGVIIVKKRDAKGEE